MINKFKPDPLNKSGEKKSRLIVNCFVTFDVIIYFEFLMIILGGASGHLSSEIQ